MELERLNQNMTLKDANPGNALRVVGLFFSASICVSFRWVVVIYVLLSVFCRAPCI